MDCIAIVNYVSHETSYYVGMQKRRNPQGGVKSKSEKFAPLHEDSAVAFPMHPPQARPRFMEVQGTSPVGLTRPYAVPNISTQSGPQLPLNASIAGSSWSKKQKEEEVRTAPLRVSSRSTKSMSVSDFNQGNYPQQQADLSSNSVGARNGAGGNHYRERASGRTRDSDVGHNDGELHNRRGDRFEGNHKTDLSSKREPSYKHDQAFMIATDGPYRRDLSAVDSHQRDSQSKVPISVNFSKPTTGPR